MVNPVSASHYSDQELLDHYRKDHNKEWLGVLLERYVHLLFGVCMKYLKQEEDAKDAVQQILLKILNELHRHHITHFKAWLYQVAKNHCLMQLRKAGNKRLQTLPGQLPAEEETGGGQKGMERELLLEKLQTAMTQLNEEQQTCIRLFYLQKRSYQEIAEMTGYSLLQVKSYIQNGKRNLKLMIERMRGNG